MKDVEIDASPARNESPERRLISNAAVRRIARKQAKSRPRRGKAYISEDEDEEEDSGFEDEKDESAGGAITKVTRRAKAVTQNLSNHYTLNMPVALPMGMSAGMGDIPKEERPYVLAGWVVFSFPENALTK
jgi:hypothetical protein